MLCVSEASAVTATSASASLRHREAHAKAAMSTMNGAKCSAYRRFRFQSHYVFYTQEPDHILIRALIHVRQDLRPSLFE